MLSSSMQTKPRFVATGGLNRSASRTRKSYVTFSNRVRKSGFASRRKIVRLITAAVMRRGTRLNGLKFTHKEKTKNQSNSRLLWFESPWDFYQVPEPPPDPPDPPPFGVPVVGETWW